MTLTATPTTDAITTVSGDAPAGDAVEAVHAPDQSHAAPAEEAAHAAAAPGRVEVATADDQGEAAAVPAGVDAARPAGSGAAPAAAASPANGATRPRGGRPAATPRPFPRADRPGIVPVPEHHHLPGWVRRDFARSRPALADLLGLLQGEQRAAFQTRVEELTTGISSGKFSLAWQYPALIDDGRKIYESQREHIAEVQRAAREVDRARRSAADRIRDAGDALTADAASRLHRALRSAGSVEAVADVAAEVEKATFGARSAGSRRRNREIEKTRSRIMSTLPQSVLEAQEPTESWQDVLKRFAEQQTGEGE